MMAEDILKGIENDKTSGASEIMAQAKECLLVLSDEFKSGSKEKYFETIAQMGKRIILAQPEMAPLFNFINEVLLILGERSDLLEDVGEQKTLVKKTSEKYMVQSKNAHKNIQKRVLDLIEGNFTILTHSYSQTVIRSLLYAENKGKNIKVIAPESRPMFEGRKTAKILTQHDIETTLIADMAAFDFLDGIDLVLTGCDTICRAGIVNKIGTLGLALAASEYKIPFYFLSEKSKLLPSAYLTRPKIEKKYPLEILDDPGHINIHNIYFDLTPHKYYTGIVTEDGMVAPSQVESLLGGLNVSSELIGL
jgi:translation initiation factor 2B subunit (eIF-2B alpha/beta/delta family)